MEAGGKSISAVYAGIGEIFLYAGQGADPAVCEVPYIAGQIQGNILGIRRKDP